VSTGGERDLGWNGPPKDGKPPSATRRLGFTDLLDILPSLSLSLIRPPKLYLSPSITWSHEHRVTDSIAQIISQKKSKQNGKSPTMPRGGMRPQPARPRVGRKSESLLARGGGGTSGNGGGGGRRRGGGTRR
jgi:hypothetical protein